MPIFNLPRQDVFAKKFSILNIKDGIILRDKLVRNKL